MSATPHDIPRHGYDMSGSLWMRLVDASSMSVFFFFEYLLARDVYLHIDAAPAGLASWLLPLALLLGYLTADFVSGFVHFLADNIGSTRTPFFGPVFIRPFREHHVDPLAITRHDFLEVNGANCLISLPVLIGTWYFVPIHGTASLFFAAYIGLFLFGIFLTNQFHSWAHNPSPPAWIRRLQRTGLILGPEHHARHHTPPFNTYYCITSGWLNPILARTRLFERMKEPLRRVLEPLAGKADEVGGVQE
ncbi:fatty acid desaturase family protein [Nannocystis pusilla]|uniref:Fatty acid desaturase family protein n=1 Tax=Nannocystis pusilla TaxID=889268 RepID=A0ABS7TZM6_9BACT|nr:fatty acid desaturase family protein [Nannocystis pusilla]MBZ5713727.1 fatty acid desaturase family protein [Nannocystis pusilla]